jgi:putative holliday junction resolvase
MRIMAVDPGEKRIGIAISDPTGTIANPFLILVHTARQMDAARIIEIAMKNEVGMIVIGQALDSDGNEGYQARKSSRLAEAIQSQTTLKVELWDESHSTQEVQFSRSMLEKSSRNQKRKLDDLAATVILQNYIEVHRYIPNTTQNGDENEPTA